jgi:hypothetical protein
MLPTDTLVAAPDDRAIPPAQTQAPFLAQSWRWIVLGLFAAWVLLVGSHHEPWFDEAQAWLMARDNGLWQLVAGRVRYEGTPGLWHTVLWLVIRAGLPYRWFFVVPAAFAIAGAAVIVWRAPFPPVLRVLLLASYFYGYQFSVVGRSYCLDLLLVPLAATFFADRVDRPIRFALVIGLIANTNAHGFLVAGVLGLELAWQLFNARRRSVGALALVGGLGLFALFCAWQPADNAFLQPQLRTPPVMTLVVYLCNAFVDQLWVWAPATGNKWDVLGSIALTLVLQRPVVALILAGRQRMMALGVVGVLLALAALVHAALWHAGVFFVFWVFLLWISWGNPLPARDRRQLIAAMGIIFALQAVQTVRSGLWDIGHVYAPGRQAAAAITAWRSTHPQGRIFGYGDYAFGVQPWFAGNVFANYHNGDPRMSYVRWDKGEPWMAGAWHMRTRMDFWHRVLAGRPDLIVASQVNRNGLDGTLADLAPDACRAGYGVRAVLPGTMIWRGAMAGNQTLTLFERAQSGPCAPGPGRN